MTIRRASCTRKPFRNHRSRFLLLFFLAVFISMFTFGPAYSAEVTLAWDRNAETNVKGYKIYYGTASRDYNLFIDVGDATTWTVPDLNEGATYYFAATAYNDSQPPAESTYSDEISKTFCSYTLSTTSQNFTASGGTGTVNVTTQTGCSWTASSGASWLTITSTTGGAVSYSVAENTSTASRTAGSTIAGKAFTVTQTGATASYTLTASAGTGGSISPAGAVSVSQGANQSFTITPSTGYTIANVVVDGSSVGAVSSYTFNSVAAAHTISATFAVNTYTLTASAGTGGSISPAGAVSVSQGANQSFTITPSTGYTIANVVVDGSSVGAVSSYTFNSVAAAHTISATFSTVCTYSASPTSATLPASGATGTATVTTQTGCSWTARSNASWLTITSGSSGTGSGTVTSSATANTSTSSRTATITIGGTTVTVTQLGASSTVYTLTASAGTGGSISPAGAVSVSQGANQSFTITPNTGYRVYRVLIDGTSVGAVSSYTFNSVAAAHTIRATFTRCTYSVSPTRATLPASGATGTATVTTQTGCSWTARSNASWLTITSGSSGTGSGTVAGSAAPNTSTTSRSTTMTVAGRTITITQLGN
ncbi:MAG: hypothetical protein A4E58_01041 [Syntrophorhabdus sp. PtaB.Bin006]|nr:MAG: hypothetical protein A4E58_01041 [Syntrophorhabdus sp. PtaB.Bin006]